MDSRGIVAVIRAPCAVRSTCLMVSTAGSPTIAAPYCATASIVRSIVAVSISGRTASWISTIRPNQPNGSQRAHDGFLAIVSALHHVHSAAKTMFGYFGFNTLDLGLAHGHVNR